MAQHLNHGVLQTHIAQVQRRRLALNALNIAQHFGRLAQQHVQGHVDRCVQGFLADHQFARRRCHTDHRKRATLALTERFELIQRAGVDRQHIAFLAFIAPNFFGRQTTFFQRHLAQIKTGTATGIIHQLGESVGQTTGAHIVDGQDGRHRSQGIAMVDHLLGTALNFGVAALHRIKIQRHAVGTTGQGAGSTAAHANAHARTTQLNQQGAGREFNFVGQFLANHAQATGQHDGLVVAALHPIHHLLVFAKVTQQIGAAKLVVESRATQGAFGHDVQG